MPNEFEQEWLDEALETLARYNVDPVVNGFLKSYGLALQGSQRDKLERIGREISDLTRPPFFEDLGAYIDEKKMDGKQHVFLYELKGACRDYLNELRDPHYIKDRLRQFDLEDSFNSSKPVWEAPEPELAEVRHFSKNGIGSLSFKWIETRRFSEWTVGQNGVQILQPKDERSTNFFIVNLKDGTAEIRIQSIRSFAAKKLREELDIYKKEINRLIKFNNFSPVLLESIIKSLLGKPILITTKWDAIPPEGGILQYAGDPSFLFKLGLPFTNVFNRELRVYWNCEQEVTGAKRLFLTLNGKSDEVEFNSITDKSRVDFILDELRKLSKESIELDELKRLAIRYPEYSRVISSIDYHFSKLKEFKIRANKLSSEVWYSEEIIKDVFKVAEENFPKTFRTEGKGRILAVYTRFSIKRGLWDYTRRKAEKSRRRKILKPVVASPFISSFGWLIIEAIRSYLTETALEEFWNSVVPCIPFKIVQGLALCIVGLVYFGSRSFGFLKKIPQQFLSATLTLVSGSEVQKTKKLNKKYKEWEIWEREKSERWGETNNENQKL